MPFDPSRATGYAPSLEEIMKDLGISSSDQFRGKVLERCHSLYQLAKEKNDIKRFPGSHFEFIICDSSQFYRSLVDFGNGNPALTIVDDLGTDVFFLIFKDKLPKFFYPIGAIHESTEYKGIQKGLDQQSAHLKACAAEIKTAEKLGLKYDYLRFLRKKYPGKINDLYDKGLI